jgi:poly(3-hydroxybutyrate) depolymerase
VGLLGAVLVACGSPTNNIHQVGAGAAGTSAGGNTGGSGSSAGDSGSAGGSAAGNTSTGGSGGIGGSGSAGSGGSTSTGGAGGTVSTGGSGGAAGMSTGGAGGAVPMGEKAGMSNGCGKALPTQLGGQFDKWVQFPKFNVAGEQRWFAVVVPTGYDNKSPARLVFEYAGCDDASAAHGSTSGYPYQTVDGKDATPTIQIGVDYGTGRADHSLCYDNQSPTSNDFTMFPMMRQMVEDMLCIDKSKEWLSGYSSGGWVNNQFSCAFPDLVTGFVSATGNEPPMQPTCKTGFPIHGLFLHDINDNYNTYANAIPGCTRLLKQNGCTTQVCAPTSTTGTTPYPVPSGLPASAPQNMKCVSFDGCPANGQVVWCTTTTTAGDNPAHYIGQDAWVTPLLWDFIAKH